MGYTVKNKIAGLSFHDNTIREYDNEISHELFDHHVNQITTIYRERKDCVCYVFGTGGHPKSTYTNLKAEPGVEVVWFDSLLPGVSKFFSFIIASYSGLIKVFDPDMLPLVVKNISHMSKAGIYVFNKSKECDFITRVKREPYPTGYDFGIKSDNNYFFYMIDADNEESSTGMYEIVSYGRGATDFANLF